MSADWELLSLGMCVHMVAMKHDVKTGLDRLVSANCDQLRGQRVGLLCHAASIASDHRHITQVFEIAVST